MSSFNAYENSERASELTNNLNSVNNRIENAISSSGRDSKSVTLIAVSKTKPSSDLLEIYNTGHRDFGENYFQELCTKCEELPKDINWHFIGHLQSTKAGPIVKNVPNLKCIETVDSEKLATKLNTACDNYRKDNNLEMFIQVDTSGEESKSGILPENVSAFAVFIRENCPHLTIKGLMTIGAPGDMTCFDSLVACRTTVASALEIPESDLQLSMGMSGDFEKAIEKGSTRVRIGSTIFGARDYSNKV